MVVFDRRVGRPEFINIGSGTAPETWRFKGNAWYDTEGNVYVGRSELEV